MPNYDYRCERCGHEFEVFQKMSDPKLEDCPVEGCGGKVKRLIGAGAGIIFKGGGFYETDYRSESYKSGEKAAKKTPDSGKSDSSKGSSEKSTSKETK